MATEPKKPAAPRRTAKKVPKAAPAGSEPKGTDLPEFKAVESRISALESELKAAENRLAQKTATLETRIGAVEGRAAPAQKVNLPEGVPEGIRQGIDRAADLVRHNPITTLIVIIALLLVAIFS